MSNDIIATLKSGMSQIKSGLDDDTRAVAGGRTGGLKRISIKGGVFRKMAGGKQIAALEDRHMNVIFVKMAHTASRQYYSGVYKEGEKSSPSCWSSDSRVPDADVRTPFAKSCGDCQHSIRGSSQGGSGSACRLSWRTAVVLPNNPSGDVMQLVLPPTSCFGKEENGKYPFRSYIQFLASNDISAGRVITRMQFDTNSPVPKLLFSPEAAVPESDLDFIIKQRNSAAAEAAIKLTVFQTDEVGVAPPITALELDEQKDSSSLIEEPKLRQPTKNTNPTDVIAPSEAVKKWAKK